MDLKGRKMKDKLRQRKTRAARRQMARAARLGLASIIIFSLAGLSVLIFRVGQAFWPGWLIDDRRAFIAILSVIVLFLVLAAPVIMGFIDDPRSLSGPGKNPKRVF